MREALLVAFHYPPEVSGGIARSLLWEEALAGAGFGVRILTPQAPGAGRRGGEILSVPLPAMLRPKKTGNQVAADPLRFLRRWIKRWLLLPDVFRPWATAAVRAAEREHEARQFAVVVTTSPPESVHGIGLALKRRGCRWLADFRDGWCFEPHRAEAALPLRRRIERSMEARVVRGADAVFAATRPIAEDLRARIPEAAAKIAFAPTGFESSIAKPENGRAQNFRLVYTGRFGLSQAVRSPAVFFEGLRIARRENEEVRLRLRLELAGDYAQEERAMWAAPDLSGAVVEHGVLSPEKALALAAGADMLLLVTPPGLASIATRKIFDYLAAGRPVFALAEANEAARILTETRAGWCVSAADPQAVAKGLVDAFAAWREGRLAEHCPCSGNDLYRSDRCFLPVAREALRIALENRRD